MTTDYKKALDCMRDSSDWVEENWKTIRRSLSIADKLMQEPSTKTKHVGGECIRKLFDDDYSHRGTHQKAAVDCFNAMRDQLIKEGGEH